MEMKTSSLTTPRSVKSRAAENGNFISKVRVIVRVRPFLPREIAAKNGTSTSCISVVDRDSESKEEVTVHLKDPDTSRNECYLLDSFFGQDGNNVSQIFEGEVRPLIPGIFQGYNATVFAYGATGSGKTYTMQGTDKLPGLMPLAMSTILSMCQRTGSKAEISYFEVYMDRCYDLLELKSKEIAILDDKEGQTHLRGLSRVTVNSTPEFQEVFTRGIQRRKIAHTGLNDVSSRSHGVLVISVSTPCPDGSGASFIGKLNLIDLAGNEDNRRTCNDGIRLQESAKINQSLFALSNVIYALNNNKIRVPYRESKLTRILQDSLGGTSRSLMVACLNPGEYQESVHTVSLAARSRHISNTSAQKLESSKTKVDMEVKLQAWLESKGKTKSAQKIGGLVSPQLPVSSTKKPNYQNQIKAKINSHWAPSNAKERTKSVPFRNLSDIEALNDPLLESLKLAEENREEISVDSAESVLEPTTKLPDKTLEEQIHTPIREKKNRTGTPRKVLSPVSSNIKQFPREDELSAEPKLKGFLEPKTPITPYTATYANELFTPASTPLDKFAATSATLKGSLIQEYIDFLNIASREELLEIKGIGTKMADYIIELRETSPLKSLSDLEKLGLSSKQVQNMFSKAARGLFDRQEESPANCSNDLLVE
ncbi:kinesin-like protein KIN-10B [Euphorbia lathyris]|uniref:kinesin-like protein KIN-10B n=1 Tax=Euphorbia lathyris TaxID=212925 RepID=UPI00331433F0